jgi:hypothetical protein
MNNKREGFAIVYGLIALLCVMSFGTAILFMVRSDRESAAHYKSSQSALQAANAALKAVEGQLANAPDTSVAILRKFLNNSNYKWFFGKTVADASVSQVVKLGSDGSKYSAKIVAFDSTNSILTIEAVGYDGMGGKKRVTAIYKLSGLSVPSYKPFRSYGLFLNGILQNCNSPINIKGDVYLSLNGGGPQHFNQGGTITGNLKTGDYNNTFDVSSNLTVTGNAYIRCPMTCNNTFTVNGKAGFQKPITVLNSDMQLYGDSYFDFSPYSNWNNSVNLHGHAITYNPCIPVAKFINKTTSTSSSNIDVATALGMIDSNEAIDTVKLPTTWSIRYVSGQITVSNLESWWSLATLYQGKWLVLRLTGDVDASQMTGTFTKKVIWITDNHAMNINGTWYDCADTSNTFIYVNGGGCLRGMGVPTNKSFRGLIYVDSPGGATYQFGTGTTFKGAIEHANGTFDLNSGTLNIDFSNGSSGQAAVDEIVASGLIVVPN